MDRQRVLVLENDGPIESVLCDLFGDEGLDVTVCGSLADLQASVKQYPRAAVVSDSWAVENNNLSLSPQHRAEIVTLARTTPVVLTTGRSWAMDLEQGELGDVTIIAKPFDLDCLMAAVGAALERTIILSEPVRT
jgi:DNA-binding NtrC family response regulator